MDTKLVDLFCAEPPFCILYHFQKKVFACRSYTHHKMAHTAHKNAEMME